MNQGGWRKCWEGARVGECLGCRWWPGGGEVLQVTSSCSAPPCSTCRGPSHWESTSASLCSNWQYLSVPVIKILSLLPSVIFTLLLKIHIHKKWQLIPANCAVLWLYSLLMNAPVVVWLPGLLRHTHSPASSILSFVNLGGKINNQLLKHKTKNKL